MRSARLYATALGVYTATSTASASGRPNSRPGSTSYDRTLYAQASDVTAALRAGVNRIEIELSDGWYRGPGRRLPPAGRLGHDARRTRRAAPRVRRTARARSSAATRRGRARRSAHRPAPTSWTGRPSTSRAGAGRRAPGARRRRSTRRRSTGRPHRPCASSRSRAPVGPRSSRRASGSPTSARTPPAGSASTDLGPAGTRTTIDYGEHVGPDGDLTTAHLDSERPGEAPVAFVQRDEVVAGARRRGLRATPHRPRLPVRAHHAVDGAPLDPASLTMRIVHTDLRRTGTFACSDDDLNRLHEIADWSFRGNAVDVPDRLPDPRAARLDRRLPGLRADGDAPVRRARLQPQVAALGARRPARRRPHRQLLARRPPHQAPPRRPVRDDDRLRRLGRRDRRRAVGAVRVLRRRAGARRELGRDGPLGRVGARAGAHRPATTPACRRSAEPAAVRAVPLGRHLPLGRVDRAEGARRRRHTASTRSSTTRWPGSWRTRARSAPPTSTARPSTLARDRRDPRPRPTMPPATRATAERVRDAWRAAYLHADGTTAADTQAGYVRALSFGLIPDELRAAAAARLVELIRAAGTHLGTGFLATGDLLPVLADTGPRRRRLRTPLPAHRAVVAEHDRPRRDDDLGGLGGHRRRTATPTSR